jgi:hypothetical protein
MPIRPLTRWFRLRGEERWSFSVRELRSASQRSVRNSGRAYCESFNWIEYTRGKLHSATHPVTNTVYE